MTAAQEDPATAEQLCIDALDVVGLYSDGDAEALQLADPEGLVLLCQLYESTLMVLISQSRGPSSIAAVRQAARETAGAWRRRSDAGR